MIAPIAVLGRGVARQVARGGALARFFLEILSASVSLPQAGRLVVWRVMLSQVWFSAIQAIPLVIVLSGIMSFLVISQAVRELGRLGATELIGRLMVIAIVRELGPLVTAVLMAGRSGTAMATELATNKVMGEVHALEGIGIDPVHYLVLPRFIAAIVSVFGLLIVFDVVAVVSGFVAASANGMSSTRYFDIVLRSLSLRDVWLTVAKGLVFGIIIGIVPSFFGLAVTGRPTEVPVASSQAVVFSLLMIFVCSALFVVITL